MLNTILLPSYPVDSTVNIPASSPLSDLPADVPMDFDSSSGPEPANGGLLKGRENSKPVTKSSGMLKRKRADDTQKKNPLTRSWNDQRWSLMVANLNDKRKLGRYLDDKSNLAHT
ncbi:hypothetical protein FB451DRAFT_1185871 [Mycena latifolia]|nr:hypothetical protein FB451DRAFT_1185871 [Mycena latifolia]